MLANDPRLELIGFDDSADNQVVRAIIPGFRGGTGHCACFPEESLMALKKATELIVR